VNLFLGCRGRGCWEEGREGGRAENAIGSVSCDGACFLTPNSHLALRLKMYFSSRPYSTSESADNLPSTSLVRVHRALYGGKGSDSHISSLPSQDDIKHTVDACYELDSGQSLSFHLWAEKHSGRRENETKAWKNRKDVAAPLRTLELAPPSFPPSFLPSFHRPSFPSSSLFSSTASIDTDLSFFLVPVYENPLFTFYDRPAITQAFLLSRFVSSSRLPLPSQICRSAVSSLGTLLGLSKPRTRDEKSWRGWEVATVWSEFGDTAESDSFGASSSFYLSTSRCTDLCSSL